MEDYATKIIVEDGTSYKEFYLKYPIPHSSALQDEDDPKAMSAQGFEDDFDQYIFTLDELNTITVPLENIAGVFTHTQLAESQF